MIDAKRKAIIFLTLAFILAIMTAWFITNQISEAQEVLGQSVQVAVAKKDIPAYIEITPDMIDWTNIPQSSDLSSLISEQAELEGNVSIAPLKKGDLFTSNLVRPRVDIPNDHRIVWLNPSDNVIMDQEIAVGDDIDVIASYKEKNDTVTKRILEDIPVIQSEEKGGGDDDNGGTARALKVSLSIPQAELLIHMQNTAEQVRVLRVTQVSEEDNGDELSEQLDETEEAAEEEVPNSNEQQEEEKVEKAPPKDKEKESKDDKKKQSRDKKDSKKDKRDKKDSKKDG